MGKSKRQPARNTYGQVKVTVTFERRSRGDYPAVAYYRVWAKPPERDWTMQDVIETGHEPLADFPTSQAEALAIVASLVEKARWMP